MDCQFIFVDVCAGFGICIRYYHIACLICISSDLFENIMTD